MVDLSLSGVRVGTMLDVGMGSGLFGESFDRRGVAVWGIDVNPEMVAAAQRHVPRGHFQQAAAEALPFADGAFDLVFLGLVLHEVENPGQVLREARRVGSGRVAVLEWPYRDEAFGPPLEHRLRGETIEALAREAGFAATEQQPLARLLLYLLHPAPPSPR